MRIYTENFCLKTSHKKGYRLCEDNWYVDNMERPFLSTETETRRKLVRIGLANKHQYAPLILLFDLLNGPRWPAIIEAKQGRLQLYRYCPLLFNMEILSTIQGIINGPGTPQITRGQIFQGKNQHMNIKSSTH